MVVLVSGASPISAIVLAARLEASMLATLAVSDRVGRIERIEG